VPDTDLLGLRKQAVNLVADCFSESSFAPLPEEDIPECGTLQFDPNVAAWKGKINCEGEWQEVIIALKSTFPDTIPRVYLVNPPKLIPHITENRHNHICAINESEVFINYEKPVHIVLDTIQAASRVISSGLKDRNIEEFDTEFQAYWRQGANQKWLSLLSPGGNPRQVWVLHFKPEIGNVSCLVAESKEAGKKWIEQSGGQSEGAPRNALYLPLLQPIRPPFPETNSEVNRALRTLDRNKTLYLYQFLENNHKNDAHVICSFAVNGYHTFCGWIHTRPNSSGKGPLCQGFRDHKIPGKVQLTSCFGSRKIIRATVDRVDADRLQARVGNNRSSSLSTKRVLIAGCGSVGSKIALNLALSGITKLTLVDNELLSTENVARHICSMGKVGKKKVDCVAQTIEQHMPHIEIEKNHQDLYEIIAKEPGILAHHDLVISATGNRNLNLRLNEIHATTSSAFSVLYAWTEVFGYASHAILVIPENGGCLHCMLGRDYDFKHRVIMLSGSESLMQEAGCGSTFLPYGAIDADMAACIASRLALSYLLGEVRRSSRWVYLGDLDTAKAQNMPMSAQYQDGGSNRLIKYSLHSSLDCNVCHQ
jgi:molybdopterin/thiamine biosynthesis adenylyltransferase